MTRFMKEISGELGQWWKDHAEKEMKDLGITVNMEAEIDSDGAIRWIISKNYLPDDLCEMLEYDGYPFSREMTRIKREAQNASFINEYKNRMKNHVYSEEELNEMRSAFGEDASIVDIITGQSIKL